MLVINLAVRGLNCASSKYLSMNIANKFLTQRAVICIDVFPYYIIILAVSYLFIGFYASFIIPYHERKFSCWFCNFLVDRVLCVDRTSSSASVSALEDLFLMYLSNLRSTLISFEDGIYVWSWYSMYLFRLHTSSCRHYCQSNRQLRNYLHIFIVAIWYGRWFTLVAIVSTWRILPFSTN